MMYDDPKKKQPDEKATDVPENKNEDLSGEKGGLSESDTEYDITIDEEIAFTPDFDDAIDVSEESADIPEDTNEDEDMP